MNSQSSSHCFLRLTHYMTMSMDLTQQRRLPFPPNTSLLQER
jgi:hypothetical protein